MGLRQVVSIYGARIGFELDADVFSAVGDEFSHARLAPSQEPPTMWYRARTTSVTGTSLYRDDPLRPDDPWEIPSRAVGALVDDLHLSVALHATDGVFLHAGVVASKGCAILLPGRSHAGKSTLVHALVRAGATYLSDEYARMGDNGLVSSYPRQIQLRTATGRRSVDPRSIGRVELNPTPVAAVLFTRYEPGATYAPEPVPPSAAALALFDNTVVAEVAPERAMSTAAQLARTAVTFRTERPDAEEIAERVLELVHQKAACP